MPMRPARVNGSPSAGRVSRVRFRPPSSASRRAQRPAGRFRARPSAQPRAEQRQSARPRQGKPFAQKALAGERLRHGRLRERGHGAERSGAVCPRHRAIPPRWLILMLEAAVEADLPVAAAAPWIAGRNRPFPLLDRHLAHSLYAPVRAPRLGRLFRIVEANVWRGSSAG
jgi:hypothetical protein